MRLFEETPLPTASLPLAQLMAHLHQGTGFAVPEGQDDLLEAYLRAAIAAIEGRIAKALISRIFRLEMADWRDANAQALPLAPVSEIFAVTLHAPNDPEDTTAILLEPSRYRLVEDLHRPKLMGTGGPLPNPLSGGRISLRFRAGFDAQWAHVPADLRQAVLLLAAQFYELRYDPSAMRVGVPAPVQSLIERWRLIRVLGGGRA